MKKVKDFITSRLKSGPFAQDYFTASRLQTFIDCPQKFYFSHIERIDNEPEERCSVSAKELGNLEHEIIATYFSKVSSFKNPFDLKLHQQICEKAVEEFIGKGKLVLNESEKSKSLNEIMHYSLNGITFLIDLLIGRNGKSIKFEVPLPVNKWSIKGFIDCLIELDSGKYILLDFKRSEAAAGAKKETLEFKKIQLWVYLMVLSDLKFSFDYFGYLNLSATEESRVLFEGEQAEALIADSLAGAQRIIEKVIEDLKTRVLFQPQPRNPKVCEFCPVYLTCSKGEDL
jgi:CRISPR/Cas system-associated exonuclease Cas4 (RecB family)